jgi:hypothetical protein
MIGRTRTRGALADVLRPDETALPFGIVDLFGNDLDAYAEIICGPGDAVAGFMTRGEGAEFGERVRVALRELGLGQTAWDTYTRLATWFEHKRIFLKVEWHRTAGGLEPLAACYFRRRPAVGDALEQLAAAPAVRERVQAVAGALGKTSIHFVSAAFRPERAPHHKLYFSQLATQPRGSSAGVASVFELFGAPRAQWDELHEPTLGIGERTFFVSLSYSGDRVAPTFKIDYPEVSPARAAAWRPAERAQVMREAEAACTRAGARSLSFLGVRFAPGAAAPALKYYADVPGAS